MRLEHLPVPDDLAARVPVASYARLLGYPDGRLRGGRITKLAEASRRWFAANARPWAIAARAGPLTVAGSTVGLDGGPSFTSPVLADRCRLVEGRFLIVALVSAGAEIDCETDARWTAEQPDEAYFLDRFGAAAAVRLGGWVSEHLTTLVERSGLGLAPGHSPGYAGWELADQPRLAELLLRSHHGSAPDSLVIHDSGMLEPRLSLLAAFAAGTDRSAAATLRSRHRCSWCSLATCRLRGSPGGSATTTRRHGRSGRRIDP